MIIERYTDAPECYDGFGTQTVRETKFSTKRGPVRVVSLVPQHQNWQEMRYSSGLHLCMDQEKWDDLKDLLVV